MAKPKLPSTSEHFATSSASRSYSPARRQNTSSRPHTQRGVPNVNFGPSSSLLAFLATVVASTPSVDGYPLYPESSPPDFLCPFLIAQDPPPLPKSRRSLKRDLGDDEPSLKYFARVERNGFVPDKYVQGEDGRWRKSTWSLYGSTYCKTPQCPSVPQDTSVPAVDDQVSATQIPTTTTSTDDIKMDTSSLPLGWKTTTDDDRISTAIILVLSLVLAVIMAFFIIGCVTWRRKRLKMSEKDLEKKAKRSQELSEDESQEEPEEVRRMKSQQRMWSRATARWKANVRISARRRRGKRQAASLSTSHSSNSLPNLSILSVNQSRVTIASEPQEESEVDTTTEHHEDPPEDGPSSSGSSLEHSSSSTHPPAYHRSAHPVESVQQRSEFTGRSADDPSSEEHLPYVPPTDGVHVATDDKQMLSQLASLASAPPPSPTSPSLCPSTGTTSDVPLASVPPMEEVEENEIKLACLQNDSAGVWTCSSGPLEHISTSEECPPVPSYSQEHSLETIFPPPPSKGTFVSAPFYDHPTSFEVDIVGIEPVEGPSAPPFESIGPSAPPLDDVCFLDTIPSAPPIPLEGPDQGPSSDPRVSDDEVSTTLGVS